MRTAFRNLDVDSAAPIDTWPYEALVALVERGTVTDWARLTAAVRRDPLGAGARQLEEYLGYAEEDGVTALLARAIHAARVNAAQQERARVAERVRELMELSGLSAAEFADRIGTSRSRLSTYRSGKVVPAATLLVRMERVAEGARRFP